MQPIIEHANGDPTEDHILHSIVIKEPSSPVLLELGKVSKEAMNEFSKPALEDVNHEMILVQVLWTYKH